MRKKKYTHPTRIFKEPEELYRAFEEFKEDVKNQSEEWVKVQFAGKDGDRKEVKQKVPLTFEGFKRFCYGRYGSVEQYFFNKDELYDDFVGICARIKNEIRENQIIGGLLNFYNPSITQRLNNLADKKDVKGEVTTFVVGGKEED